VTAEIERKFLLAEAPDRLGDSSSTELEQGYVALAPGVEVRLRKAGDRRLMTVKRGDGEVREEVEIDLGGDQFEALWPLTDSQRLCKTRYLIPLGDGLVAELDVYERELDGLVTAEVEFDSPERSRAFQPPRWLGEEITGDRRYSNRSLALEGPPRLGSAGNEKHRDMQSRSYRLKSKEGPAEGVRRIALGRTEKALERLRDGDDGELASAIHGARKDLKKLRGVLRLIRDELGGKAFRTENRRYRDAGRLLSGSRDVEAKLETLLRLHQRFGDLPKDAVEQWEGMLESERDELAAAVHDEAGGQIDQVGKAIEAGREEIRQWPLEADSWALLGPGLARSYRDGRRGMKRVLEEPSTENVHEWRKRAKDLWYQLRILRDAWPEPLGATVDQADRLADLLGQHHDLAVLAEDLRSRPDLGERGAFEKAIERRQGELLDAAVGIGRRLYAEKPKAFSRRIAGYWSAWRDA
jgi:CYTH domain-containing protein/CHAD domain-containing protein